MPWSPFFKGGIFSVSFKPLFAKLIMRHIFWSEHRSRKMLFCLGGRLWASVYGTNYRIHSSDDRARAGDVAGDVVAPGVWETELAQPQWQAQRDELPRRPFETSATRSDSVARAESPSPGCKKR